MRTARSEVLFRWGSARNRAPTPRKTAAPPPSQKRCMWKCTSAAASAQKERNPRTCSASLAHPCLILLVLRQVVEINVLQVLFRRFKSVARRRGRIHAHFVQSADQV